ncbi:MAG: DUF2934 domain-containing protein [Isosphaerales bacterium]
MLPTDDQIRQAAYDLWERRGRVNGRDRLDWYAAERELEFSMNYQTIVEYSLDVPGMLVLGDRPTRYCRFCERTSVQVGFGAQRPVVPGVGPTSLYTEAVCDDCQANCLDPLAVEFERFWSTLRDDRAGHDAGQELAARNLYSLAVLKSLIASALLIMPQSELAYFVDTLEWVNNPNHRHDARLFAETVCHVYAASFLRDRSRTRLARRIDADLPLPYMIYFLSRGGIMLQVHLPLCLRDQDLDGRVVRMPERSLTQGEGPQFQESRSTVLQLVTSEKRVRS